MIKKNKTEALYLALNILLFIAFAIFVPLKLRGMDYGALLNFPAMGFFAALSVLIILLLMRDRPGCFTIFVALIAMLFVYDAVAPEAWIDARGDWETAKLVSVVGLRDYHAPAANLISADEYAAARAEKYQKLLPFYPLKERLESVAKPTVKLENDRRMHHPPLYFFLLSLWMKITDSVVGLKILSKIMYLIYILLIYNLISHILSLSASRAQHRYHSQFSILNSQLHEPFSILNSQFSIIFTAILASSPVLLLATQSPKSDLPLGIIIAWLVLAIFKHGNKQGILPSIYIGIIAALAVFTKFTALILVFPLIFLAFYWHGMRAPLYLFFMAIPLVFSVFILYHFFGYDLILNVLTGRIVQDQWVSGNITAKAYLIQRVALGSFRIGIPMLTAIPFALITKKQDRPQFAPNFNLLVPENPAKEYTQHSALINQPDWDSMDSTLIEKGKPDTEQKSANSQLNNLSPARTASSHSQFSIVNSPLNKPFSIVNRTQCPTRRSRPSPNFLLTTLHCCVATYFALPLLLWGSSIDRHQIGFLPLAVPIIAIGLSRLQKVRIPVLWLMFFYNILFLFYSVLENTIEMQYLVY